MLTPELGILADDLTGATDTGLQFAKRGRRTGVSLSWPVNVASDVLVVDLDSRSRSADEARERAASATRAILAGGTRRLYKKIDSTGRGNLGAEIEGTLQEYRCLGALVCPAFPALGRTVRGGQIYVGGARLDQTEFAADPLWPATTASVETMLRRQTELATASLDLTAIRRGPSELGERLAAVFRQGARLVVADAETPSDLKCQAEALERIDAPVLPVGSAGLAEWLADSLGRPSRVAARSPSLAPGPLLVVAGTMSRVGLSQLACLVERGAALVTLPLEPALGNPLDAGDSIAAEVIRCLWTASCVVVALVDPRGPPPDLRPSLERRQLTPAVVTERLMEGLARAVERALDAVAPSALILTGGDTARAVCATLGVQALEVFGEAAPGVPICLFQGGRWDGLPVVTKAGGFGQPDTLDRVIQLLEATRT